MFSDDNKKAVIFDMDGTIWDSSEEVAAAWLEACEALGLKGVVTKKKIQDCMGLVMDDIFDRLLPDSPIEFRRLVQDRCEKHENEYLKDHCGRVYDGLKETVMALRNAGLMTLIVTNAQDGYVQAFLAGSGMDGLFDDYEMYGRTGLLKADNISLIMRRNGVSEAVYVGDTELDMISAGQAGIPFIHAAYGFGTAPGAEHSADCPAAITEEALRILGK
ncbi:MAG: HAD family hydrolase [Firmicutes bacterium]|nr:HAD family hydrolase [Bacillota bacterium]